MSDLQTLISDTKARFNANAAKYKRINEEIQQKQEAANQLQMILLEDQGALKALAELVEPSTEEEASD